MTTPDTSAVRAWARENGYDVADRGRLPAELTDAYLAATRTPGKDTKRATKKAAPKAAPAATKAAKAAPAAKPAKVVKAPGRSSKAAQAAEVPVDEVPPVPAPEPADAPASEPAPEQTPRPKPSLVNDDRRLVALGEEIAALAKRVEALEKAAGGKSSAGKTPRFRRRS